MPAFIDRTGHRYGRLTVLRRAENDKHGNTRWECLCDCGTFTVVNSSAFWAGRTRSCGCRFNKRSTTHGLHGTRTYKVWGAMKDRCSNPNNKAYRHYGGRGIKVCERWMKFENFLADMGEVPEGMSIERVDVNGDYCPDNCVWLPLAKQNKNTRTNVRVTYKGREMIALDFAREIGRNRNLIYCWLKQGLTPEQIAAKPTNRRRNS